MRRRRLPSRMAEPPLAEAKVSRKMQVTIPKKAAKALGGGTGRGVPALLQGWRPRVRHRRRDPPQGQARRGLDVQVRETFTAPVHPGGSGAGLGTKVLVMT